MGDPGDVLAEQPDLEPALRAVVAVDEETETWTFDDVAVDSGAFGELVSEGVVEKTGDGRYRLADPAAARAALDGEGAASAAAADETDSVPLTVSRPTVDVDAHVAAALAGALALVVAFRLVILPSVFRDGHVVLAGNDPYAYRYWVERIVGGTAGPLDLPETVATGEPLMVATLSWVTGLLGGGTTTAGQVLAVYPVASAVVTGVLVYLLARELTGDVRVGIAAVLLLAITPGHALRTVVGFADHHAFDYPWLVLTALALVVLVRTRLSGWRVRPSRRVALATVGLAAGVAGQVLAWEAGPLLLAPVAVTVAAAGVLALRDGESPALALAPTGAGLAVAALLAAAVHLGAGWQEPEVAFAPAVLLAGTVGVAALGEVFDRFELSAEAFAGTELAGAVVGVAGTWLLRPGLWAELSRRFDLLFARRDIVEVQPLFSADTFGWLFLFGFGLVLALPYVAWAGWRAYRGDGGWLAAGAYGGWLLLLAAIQMRFAGELAAFAAVFAGLGLVHLAAWVDLARPPVPFAPGDDATTGGRVSRRAGGDAEVSSFSVPDRGTAASLVVLFLLVGSIGMLQTPVKTSQVAISEDVYRSATAVDGYAEERDLTYPEDYVLSRWWRNRVYNYFVNGESASYGYARDQYTAFLSSSEPGTWYERFEGRVGFVVTTNGPSSSFPAVHSLLHKAYGSRTMGYAGSGHYRAVYVTGERKVFALVPGANLTGTGPPNETLAVATDVRVAGADGPVEFTYERQVETGPDGRYNVTVAYPGEYTVGNRTVTVPETAVEDGEPVAVGS